jgi:hypothetical protein
MVSAYAELGGLAFAYSQGSMVEGLSNTSDIDTVCVWVSTIPEEHLRPPKGIVDLDSPLRVFHRQETFWFRGQEFGVAHATKPEWEVWLQLLNEGEGCSGYPMPLIAAHGLLTGSILYDPSGAGGALQAQLKEFPEELRLRTAARARQALPSYLEVSSSAPTKVMPLISWRALGGITSGLVGWFSAQRVYWPLEKRLHQRLCLMNRKELAEAEERVWLESTLEARLNAFKKLIELLLSEMPEGP